MKEVLKKIYNAYNENPKKKFQQQGNEKLLIKDISLAFKSYIIIERTIQKII